ncbi:MAG: hypothetical protein HDT18_02640 [Oscillibacter sp.]|nr:hypothetical protein [Oscillibacter sp.]
MKKYFKILSKRGLALFLVLTMCISLLPTQAMAAEFANEAEPVFVSDVSQGEFVAVDEISDAVRTFLAAVKAIPEEITEADASLVAGARLAYEALTEDERDNADVAAALAALEAAEAALKAAADDETADDETEAEAEELEAVETEAAEPEAADDKANESRATTTSYDVYCYTLIPGKNVGDSNDMNQIWNGMGVAEIRDVPDPATCRLGEQFDWSSSNLTFKESFPAIDHEGTRYTYVEDDSVANIGNYTIQWYSYVSVSNGANAGNNGKNPPVNSSINTFHLDGRIKLYTQNIYTVDFLVQQPGKTEFTPYDIASSQRVENGFPVKSLRRPAPVPELTKDSLVYTFDGWYTSDECREDQKVNFDGDGVITGDTTYYGRYVSVAVPTEPLVPEEKAVYIVQWLDEDGNKLDEKFRSATVGETVRVEDTDKDEIRLENGTIYEFDADNTDKVTEATLTKDGCILKLYFKVSTATVTIKYYLDEVKAENEIDTDTKENVRIGELLGLNNVELNAYKPATGYKDGVQQGTVPYTVVKGENVINVVYEKKDTLSYTIKYYLGEVKAENEIANSETPVNNVTFGKEITLTTDELNAYKPTTGYKDGVQQGTVPYVIIDGENVINVVYPAKPNITVNAIGINQPYDGKTHSITVDVIPVDAEVKLYSDAECTTEITNEFKDVLDSTTVYVKATHPDYNDVTAPVTVNITKVPVTLTSESATKDYDGEALEKKVVTVTSGAFVDGEGVSYQITGSQTEVGSSKNYFTYTWNAGTKSTNYDITPVMGDLEVLGKVIFDANYENSDWTKEVYPVRLGESVPVTDDEPHRENYTLLGWATTAGAEKAEYVAGDNVQMGKENITLYAVWSQDTYTVTVSYLLTDDGVSTTPSTEGPLTATVNMPNSWSVAVEDDSATITAPKTVGDYVYDAEATLALNDLSGSANKGDIVEVTLVYALDNKGGENGEGDGTPDYKQAFVVFVSADKDMGTVSGKLNQVFTLVKAADGTYTDTIVPRTTDVNAEPNPGYVFDSWNPTPNVVLTVEGGKTYVFTAIFDKLYPVTFDANGGSWKNAVDGYTMGEDNKTAAKNLVQKDTVSAINPEPTRDGYKFTGWYADKDAKTQVPQINGNGVTLAALKRFFSNDVVLYAGWEAVDLTYSVRYHYINGTEGQTNANTVNGERAVINTSIQALIKKHLNSFTLQDGNHYVYVEDETTVNGEKFVSSDMLTKDNTVIDLYFYVDNIGVDDPNTGDNIPDKYQVVVTYTAINGTVNLEKAVVTLRGEDGNPAENGVGHLTEKQIAKATADAGYDQAPAIWDPAMPTPATDITEDTDYVITFTKNIYTITVEVENGEADVKGSVEVEWNENQTITFTANPGYVLDTVTVDGKDAKLTNGTYTFTNVVENHSIKVVYAEDKNNDSIPDKYQVTVEYESVDNRQGTVTGTTAKVFTLKDADGNYAVTGSITPGTEGVVLKVEPGYTFDKWDHDPTEAKDVTGGDKVTYKAMWKEVSYKVTYVDGEEFIKSFEVSAIDAMITIDDGPEAPAGKVFTGWRGDYGKFYTAGNRVILTGDLTLIAQWEDDVIGPNGGPDGIPDKYQVEVIFAGVNGTVDGLTQTERVVTLMENGKWSENGSYTLTDKDLPDTAPAEGYTGEGTWDENPLGVVISKSSTKLDFVITFVKDSFDYTVNYLDKGGEVIRTAKTAKAEFESEVTSESEVVEIKGYVFDHADKDSIWIGANAEENVINLYYSIDPNQTKALSYTVEYYKDGEKVESDTQTVTETVQVLQPDTLTVKIDEINVTDKYYGYKCTTTTIPNTVNNGDTIKVYYVIDENATKTLSYTVNHVVNGDVRDTFTEKVAVQVLQPDTIARNVALEADQNYTGYVKTGTNPAVVPAQIDNGAVITVNYDIDAAQTKTLSYTVNHVVNGDVRDSFTETATVQVLQPDTIARNEALEADQNYTGYVKTGTNPAEVPAQIDNGATIYVIYARDGFDYTVNYLDTDGEVIRTAKTAKAEFESVVTSESEVVEIAGYVFHHADKDSITIDVVAAANVINLYYAVDRNNNGVDDSEEYRTITYTDGVDTTVVFADVVITEVNGQKLLDGDATPTIADPVRAGYVFTGWAPAVTARINGDAIYVAQWNSDSVIAPPDPTTPDIPEPPTPLGPGPDDGIDIEDEEIPLANAVGLNDTEHFAYIIGYEDDTVRPLNNITRAEAVTIFFRLMTDEYRAANWSTENSFSDVNVGNWYNNAVSTLLKAGALEHFAQDDAFLPNQAITRAEFASIAAGFVSDEITGEEVGDFSDTEGHWASLAIRKAVQAGWINGVGGNRFAPDETITRAEVMTMINRMLDRVPDAEHMLPTMKVWSDNPEGKWYYEAVQEATNGHEYERDEMGVVETWTELAENRDWAALESEWAANGGSTTPVDPAQPVEGETGSDSEVEND